VDALTTLLISWTDRILANHRTYTPLDSQPCRLLQC